MIRHALTTDQYASPERIMDQIVMKAVFEPIEENGFYFSNVIDSVFSMNEDTLLELLSKLGDVFAVQNTNAVVAENFVLFSQVVSSDGDTEDKEDSGILLKYYCSFKDNDAVVEQIKEIFMPYKKVGSGANVTWATMSRGDVNFAHIYTPLNEQLHNEAYPSLGKSIDEYINDFLDSDESVLILRGQYGCGKTRLVRYIAQVISDRYRRDASVLLTMDQKVFSDDSFYLRFLRNSFDFLFLEDIDMNLRPRKDGNNLMHKFLASSDGFLRNKRKKLILTTNLVHANSIDEALTRPGRCFDHLLLENLGRENAIKLAIKLNPALDCKEFGDRTTVADVYKAYNLFKKKTR